MILQVNYFFFFFFSNLMNLFQKCFIKLFLIFPDWQIVMQLEYAIEESGWDSDSEESGDNGFPGDGDDLVGSRPRTILVCNAACVLISIYIRACKQVRVHISKDICLLNFMILQK